MNAQADRRSLIAERTEVLRDFPGQRLPESTPELLGKAEHIAAGTVFFYDRQPVEVGLKDIDWSGSHIKHQEWPAQLNRFRYLIPLACAYRHTTDERFARAARAYIEDWLRLGSYETGHELRPGDNTLRTLNISSQTLPQ